MHRVHYTPIFDVAAIFSEMDDVFPASAFKEYTQFFLLKRSIKTLQEKYND
jgi:hypothetical protein